MSDKAFKVFDGATGQPCFERGHMGKDGEWVKDETFQPDQVEINGKPYLSVSIPSPPVWEIGEDGKPRFTDTGEAVPCGSFVSADEAGVTVNLGMRPDFVWIKDRPGGPWEMGPDGLPRLKGS